MRTFLIGNIHEDMNSQSSYPGLRKESGRNPATTMRSAGDALRAPQGRHCAGDFLDWLQGTLSAFFTGQGAEVPCGDCRACCRAGYFIPVRHHEWSTLAAIPRRLLVSPPVSAGEVEYLIATTRRGACALLDEGACSIYRQRPQACRDYDCRVFAAAGIESGQDLVDRQIRRWRFRHDREESRLAHAAVRAAARFVIEHPDAFPEGRAPRRPADIALVALKSHHVFLGGGHRDRPREAVAEAVVRACRVFDATGNLHPATAEAR